MNGGTQELTKTAVVKEMPLGIPEVVREALHREVEQLWAKAYTKAHDLTPGGFFAMEREIREDALKVGGTVLGLALERGMGTGYQGTSMSCESGKQPARCVNHRDKTIFTLMHPVGVKLHWLGRYGIQLQASGRFPAQAGGHVLEQGQCPGDPAGTGNALESTVGSSMAGTFKLMVGEKPLGPGFRRGDGKGELPTFHPRTPAAAKRSCSRLQVWGDN